MITHVRKRNGRVVPYDKDKIILAIDKAFISCGQANTDLPQKIAKKVEDYLIEQFLGRYPMVEEVQDIVEEQLMLAGDVQVAKAYILYRDMRNRERSAIKSTDYQALNAQLIIRKDGFFQLHKDKEALQGFLKDVDGKTLKFDNINDRLKYLIGEGFYENFYDKYNAKQIEEVYKSIKKEKFSFQSFMSASKFYRDYALKTNDKKTYLETYEDRVLAVALHLANGDCELLKDISKAVVKQYYQPATPTFLNAGKKNRGELVSCFLLEVDDTLNSIGFNLSTAMYLSKIGGGVALNLSKLRARGETIKDVENVGKGVIPVVKLLEDAFNYADQMGQRKGAGAAYLNIFHADVEDFLDTKKINADEKSRIQSLSLGLTVPSKFFELAKDNAPYYVFYPLTVFKEYGIHLDDMDMNVMYDKLVGNPNVRKRKLDAREMLNTIAKTQFESGYPYMVYVDNANDKNPLKSTGRIKMSNLCTEIFQNQSTSIINDYNQQDILGNDVSCVLGSINIVNVMESKDIEFAIRVATEALTKVTDLFDIPNAPTIQSSKQDYRAIGIGAMNLHGFFVKNKIQYDSKEAIDFVRTFFMIVNYYSIYSSMNISKRRNDRFKGFNQSEYAKGTYFDKYTSNDYSPNIDSVKKLFDGINIPTKEDWEVLKKEVMKNGLYHAYRLAIAPTQAISYVQNATPSIQPIVDLIETRTYANATTYYPMPYLTKETIAYYTPAYAIDNAKIIDLVASIQEHVDQGISTVLFVTNMSSTRDLAKLYIYAHRKGLKSLYYTRTKNLTIEECIACSV